MCRRRAAVGVGTPPHRMCIRNRAPPFYFSSPSKQATADNIAIVDIALNPGILLSYHKLWSVGSDRIAAFNIKTQSIYFIHFSGLSIIQYAEVLPLLLNLILVALCAPLPFITSVSYFRAWQVITSPSMASPLFLHIGIKTTYSTLSSSISSSTISCTIFKSNLKSLDISYI